MASILERLGGGEGIPRQSLSTVTRRNLEGLESLGFVFGSEAEVYPVQQEEYMKGKYVGPGRLAKSFVIRGDSPGGEEAVYVRWETKAPGAGQTYVYVGGKRYRVTDVLSGEVSV